MTTAGEPIGWASMSLAGGLRDLLRPPPHRGPLIAAGGVALAVGLALVTVRLRPAVAGKVGVAGGPGGAGGGAGRAAVMARRAGAQRGWRAARLSVRAARLGLDAGGRGAAVAERRD